MLLLLVLMTVWVVALLPRSICGCSGNGGPPRQEGKVLHATFPSPALRHARRSSWGLPSPMRQLQSDTPRSPDRPQSTLRGNATAQEPEREAPDKGETVQESKSIVVGYDGSAQAARAVRWAAEQAALRNCPLHLVHCTLWPRPAHDLGSVPGVADSGPERSAQVTTDEGLAHVKQVAPGVEVRTSLVYGWPSVHLPKISAGEELLVVGSRGIGGFVGLLVGSVSLEMAATAACPVAVIRSDEHADGPVVVAIDNSGSTAALEDACTLAGVTGADLIVVHVEHAPAGYRMLRDPVDAYPAAEALLDSAVSTARDLAPGITVEKQLLTDTSIPRGILNAAQGARITVVGTKGHGLIKGTIGSTAHAVLHHAKGPVLISRRNTLAPGDLENL